MATITFTFDSIEEEEDIKTALNGYKYKLAINEFDNLLRSTTKHEISILNNSRNCSELEYQIAEKLREELRSILYKFEINL